MPTIQYQRIGGPGCPLPSLAWGDQTGLVTPITPEPSLPRPCKLKASGTGRKCPAGQLLLFPFPLLWERGGECALCPKQGAKKINHGDLGNLQREDSELIPQLISHCASLQGQGHRKREIWKMGKTKQLALTHLVSTKVSDFLVCQIGTAQMPYQVHLISLPSDLRGRKTYRRKIYH